MTRIIEYKTKAALFEGLANSVIEDLEPALADGGNATLAVPGGTTPKPFFVQVRTAPIAWSRVRVLLTDERFVPETSPRSNTKLVRGNLLKDRAAAARLVPFYKDADTPEDALSTIARSVAAALPITSCVLGMGTDMHTASLFPGADNLAAAFADDAPDVLAMRAPGAEEPRLTLSARVLRDARAIHILIVGADKRKALEAACEPGPVADAPVRAVLDQALVHWSE